MGVFETYQCRAISLHGVSGPGALASAIGDLRELEAEVSSAGMTAAEHRSLTFTLSSVMINLASDAGSVEDLRAGVAWATRLLGDGEAPAVLVAQARYNRANGLAGIFAAEEASSREPGATGWPSPAYRLAHLDGLREPRMLYRRTGADLLAPAETRGMALCNLGNLLDDSGRWVEAYTAYADALEADPTNGNAAGNIAELLRRRLGRWVDQRGHLAAVYDKYVTMAKSLRERTVEVAGPAAAGRWDALEPTGSRGHLRHDGDQLDPYQCWIVRHRLALVASVEGLGSDSRQWDTASVSGVASPAGERVPGIFGALNVLKAEFLVARRLAFQGQRMHAESPARQHPGDPGLYTDTLDGSLYGEPPALLLLAHRSALDVLDKIAVTANEHFGSGLAPARVEYSRYWCDSRTGQIRPQLGPGGEGLRCLQALAELAGDLSEDGMYPSARLLRNAGTHRLVHATTGEPTGPTQDTFSTVNMPELQTAAIEALQVSRAAYLYFVDLIDSQLSASEGAAGTCRLPNQR
ncbi:MAG: LA2681 family HEPN domain-containing protein [Trebonia sp.]